MPEIIGKLKEIASKDTFVLLASGAGGYFGARLLQKYGLSKIEFAAKNPEIADATVMIVALFLKGNIRTGVLAGAGISLIDNLFKRFGVEVL